MNGMALSTNIISDDGTADFVHWGRRFVRGSADADTGQGRRSPLLSMAD